MKTHACWTGVAALVVGGSAVLAADGPADYAKQAEALAPMAQTDAARAWLDQAGRLPEIEPRKIWYSFRPKRGYTSEQYEALPEAEREGLTEGDVTTDETYYDTFYGTPIAYLRALDLAGAEFERTSDEPFEWAGVHVLDFGYGQVGQLRMLAQLGAHAVGVDVDPILGAIYSEPGDQGPVERTDAEGGEPGSVTLLHGLWPNDEAMREAVRTAAGDPGYDLIVARNILKRGYVAPTNGSGAWVDLGGTAEQTLKTLHDTLLPGGVFVIYSIGGAHPEGGYNPSCDIASPWTAEQYEGAGFEVVTLDADENETCREVGRRLGWDQPPSSMDLEHALFGVYTILRKPAD